MLLPLLLAVVVFAGLLVAVRLRMQQRWLFLAARGRDLVGADGQRRGPAGRRAGDRAGRPGVHPEPRRPGGGDRPGTRSSARSRRPSSPGRPRLGLTSTLSPNARLQAFYHPWTSYVIVPLFALANAGIELDADFLRHAYAAPVTLGVLVGYVVGKPVAVVGDLVGRDVAQPRPGAAAGGVGGGDRQRHHLRDRLHRGVADRHARLRRRRARRGQARRAVRGRRLGGADLGRLPARRAALPRPAGTGPARRHDPDPGPDPRGGPRARPHPRTGRRTDHGDRVRRLRVPALRAGRARRARPARGHATSATSGDTCRFPTYTRRRSWPPRRPRRRPRRASSGRCTTCCSSTRTSCRART